MSISSMKSAVSNYVSNAIYTQTERQKAKRGIVRGGCVVIGNDVLPFIPAVDMYFQDGDAIWCLVSDSGTAVIIGV